MLNIEVTIAPCAAWPLRPRWPTAAKRSSSTPSSSPASSGGFASGAASACLDISAGRAACVDHHVWDGLVQLPESHVEAALTRHVLESGRPHHREPGAHRRPPPGAPRRLAAELGRREWDELQLP